MNVGTIGRLTKIKNHKMFIDAICCLMYPQKRDMKFFIIGDGELRSELEQQSFLLGDCLIFTGWQDMIEVYRNLDIVVCTSNNEGTPVALIEAAVFGLPIISTNVGGVKDIFKDSESILYVMKNDYGDLADAIIKMAKNIEVYKNKANEFRKVVYNRFRKEKLIENIKQLYEKE